MEFISSVKSINLVLTIISLAWSSYVMINIKKNVKGNLPLNIREKILVIIPLVLNPIFAGLVFYLGWNKKFPKKANQVGKYFLIIFPIEIIIAFCAGFYVGLNHFAR